MAKCATSSESAQKYEKVPKSTGKNPKVRKST